MQEVLCVFTHRYRGRSQVCGGCEAGVCTSCDSDMCCGEFDGFCVLILRCYCTVESHVDYLN